MKGFVTLILLTILFVPQFSALGYVHEKSTYYHDTLFGKTFQFEPSPEEIVVVFNRGADFDAFEGTYNLDRAQVLDRQKLVGVYRIPDGLVAGDVIDLLEADPMVNRAAPAYIDQEGFIKYCVPTELTVRFNDGVAESRMTAIIEEVGSSVVRKQWTPGYFTISAPETRGYFETVRKLYKYKEVKFSEPSIISYNDFCFTPDDEYFDQQWALKNTGQIPTCSGCTPYGDHDIDAEPGWDIGRGDPGVVISIIDTGMDLDHPDLAGNLLPRNGHDWDFADPNDDSPDDTHGHGTKCSGISAAVTNNGIGVAGVGHLCQIMPLRVDLISGHNQNRADAINYATSRRPDFDGLVLSNSWRMSSGDFTAVHEAIVNAYANDVLVCFAAGNTNGSVNYPAIYPEAMAIAATSPCDERKNPSSCDGEGWGSSYGPELDCAAPGVKIYTTSLYGNYTPSFNGTSSACPHAAGLAAVIWSLDPTLSNVEIREIINESADQVGGYYYDPGTGKSLELGHGRINLAAAAELALPLEITWREHRIPGHITGSYDVFAIDLDRDGDQDVLASAFNEDAVIWWENLGPMQFPPWREHYISENVRGAFTVYAADLDRDGDIDILAGGKYLYGFLWWENNGSQYFREHWVDGGYGVLDIYAVDLNRDGYLDVLGAIAGDSRISWWKNDGNLGFVEDIIVDNFGYAISVYALDMDFDRDIDVLGAAMNDDKISWFENNGNQYFREHVISSHVDGASDVHAVDIDRDNDIDILGAAALESGFFYLWEYVGPQQEPPWIEHRIAGHFTGTMDIYAADMTADGLPDIVVAAPYENAIIWWENLGEFDFEENQITTDYNSAWEVYPVDLDNDTDIDILGAGSGVVEYVSWWESDLVSGGPPKRESEDRTADLPERLLVSSAYPNPFNASITIHYDLPEDSHVTIDIFDILGRRLTTLVNETQPAGSHHMIWNGADGSSGIYFYRIQAGEFLETKRMTLLK